MQLYTIDYIPEKSYELLGLVKGSMVQSKHVGRDIMATLKGIIGGEIRGYTEMLNESREVATDRMIAEAQKLSANAIISIRYITSSVMEGTCEVLVYGTAIRIK